MTREFEVKKDQFVQTIDGPRRKPLSGREIKEREVGNGYVPWRGWETGFVKELEIERR